MIAGQKDTLLVGKQSGAPLVKKGNCLVGTSEAEVYPLLNGILIMEKSPDTDLRIPAKQPDLHKLREERKYFGDEIISEVEYLAYLHTTDFANFHVDLLLDHLKHATIVDLGCGQLPYINAFPPGKIRIYYGLDLSQESLVVAREHFRNDFELSLVQHGVYDTPFPDGCADAVVSGEVIEHLDEPLRYLGEIHRICKQDGYLSISTPCVSMYYYPHNLLRLLGPGRIKAWHKRTQAHRCWQHALTWHPGLRPKILRSWLQQAGFTVVRHETRLWYFHTPLRLSWRLFALFEKLRVPYSGRAFGRYLQFTDRLLELNLPVLRWAGIRQFALCQKK